MYHSEKEFQQDMVAGLRAGRFRETFGVIERLQEKPPWRGSVHLPSWVSGFPDVVIHTKSVIFIVELKHIHIGVHDMVQIGGYMESAPTVFGPCRQKIWGVVIGHHVARTVDQISFDIANRFGPVTLMTYAVSGPGEVTLQPYRS
jgi:hypothetical protein